MTTQQIARLLPGEARTTIYRHIALLVEGGVLRVESTHQVRGITEKVYALNEAATDLTSDERATLTPDDHQRYFSIFVSELMSACQAYLERPQAMTASALRYWGRGVYLTEAEYATCWAAIEAAIDQARVGDAAGERRRYVFFVEGIPAVDDHLPPSHD